MIGEIGVETNQIIGITHITCKINDTFYHWQLYSEDYYNYLMIGKMECVRNSFERIKLIKVLEKIRNNHKEN